MEGILNLLRKLGYSENEIKTVLNKVPTSQEGLMGTNVATGIFSKPKEGKLAKDFLVSDVIGNPFEIDYYKGRSKEDILTSASAQLKMIDDEFTKLTDQIINKNLQLTQEQKINFAKNLEAKRRFEKDFEAFKTRPEAEVLNIETGKKVGDIETLKEKSGLIAPPTTDLGRIDLRNKQMLQKADEFFKSQEEVEKAEAKRQALIAKQYEGKGYAGGTFGPSGMYRSVARDFLLDQNAKGKIKLTDDVVKNLEERNYISGGQPLMYPDPIRVMRFHYGDDVFDKIPLDELNKTSGAKSDILGAMSKIEAKPVKAESPATPGGYMTPGEIKANIEELENIERMIKRREYRFADMTDQQIKNELEHYGSQKNAFEIAFGYDHPEAYEQYIKSKPEKKANGGRIGYAEGTPSAGLVVTNWEGPWTGPQILGGPKPGEYANQRSGITSIQSNRVLKPEYRNGIPIGLVMPQDFYYMDAPSVINSSSESNPNLSLKDQYLNKLSAIQSSGSSYEDFKNLLESKLQKKANGGAMGLDYLTGQEPPKNGYAMGGRISYADGSDDAPSITLDSYKDGRLGPEDSLSKYKSYSELELLGNIDAKKPNYEIPEENQLHTMPIYKPKNVAPPKSYSPMPVEEYLRRRHQLDLADGGRVNLQKGSIPKILEFLIDKLSKEKNFNKTLLEKSSPKAIQDLYIEKYGSLPSAEEIKDIVNKQLQNKGSMEVTNPKTGEVTTPKNPIMTVEDLQFKHKEAFKAHDQIFNVDINDKIAPDMIAESMAEMKGKDYFSLSQKEQSDLYKKALAYVDDVRMTKRQNKPIEGGFSFNDPDIKAQMEEAMTVAKKRGDEMRAMGLDPAKSKDYDEYIKIKEASGDKNFNKYFDDLEIKTKFKGRISDDLLNQILMDDNLQRKAEVVASIEQGLVMQEKGMSPEQIVDILKNTKRTKQAQGGPIGLNYLMGF
jgi:hypothetical protein